MKRRFKIIEGVTIEYRKRDDGDVEVYHNDVWTGNLDQDGNRDAVTIALLFPDTAPVTEEAEEIV